MILDYYSLIKMRSRSKQGKIQDISSEIVDSFIRCIQALNFDEMKRYLMHYGNKIANCLESRTRMPSLYFAIGLTDQKAAILYIKQLLKSGANLSFRDQYSNTYLHYACSSSKLSVFKFLIRRKLSIKQSNMFKQSILFSIAKYNSVEHLQYLAKLQQEIDVNQEDIFKRTPLFYASEKGNLDICQILLKIGAVMDKVDIEGHNVQYYAKKNSKTLVLNLFSHYQKGFNIISDDPEEAIMKFSLCYMDDNLKPKRLSVAETLLFLKENTYLQEMFTNSMSLKEIEQTEESWQVKAQKTVKSCLKCEGCQFFEFPVNQADFGITDYYQKISKPMDFSKIIKKLTYHVYPGKQEFKRDVKLIFDNCFEYNGIDHQVSKIALQIKNHFQSKYQQTI